MSDMVQRRLLTWFTLIQTVAYHFTLNIGACNQRSRHDCVIATLFRSRSIYCWLFDPSNCALHIIECIGLGIIARQLTHATACAKSNKLHSFALPLMRIWTLYNHVFLGPTVPTHPLFQMHLLSVVNLCGNGWERSSHTYFGVGTVGTQFPHFIVLIPCGINPMCLNPMS